ncbi:uncharacterized protein LOC110919896 [Helianthus annuus]|uniref:uncharacterized protein LOC110919896 n=1 Tax=Helianthus annuus TaxID=4232 RepID=UPI000B8FF599|nr:uncharacterized protein LOC110919896 [Helianthus annuus]
MCSSNSKNAKATPAATTVPDINGRLVLQPATSNQRFKRSSSLKKSLSLPKSTTIVPVPPPPPKQKQGGNNKANSMNSTTKTVIPNKKPKKSICINSSNTNPNSLVVKYLPEVIVNAPGSIAAAWKEQVEVMQVQSKIKIAHYGRSIKPAKYDSCKKLTSLYHPKSVIDRSPVTNVTEEKRCSFITPYSDPIFIAYHDEEWGIPVHDDNFIGNTKSDLLFECASHANEFDMFE